VQSTPDLDYYHARDLPCSRVKSHDDPISECRGERTQVSFVYIDANTNPSSYPGANPG